MKAFKEKGMKKPLGILPKLSALHLIQSITSLPAGLKPIGLLFGIDKRDLSSRSLGRLNHKKKGSESKRKSGSRRDKS